MVEFASPNLIKTLTPQQMESDKIDIDLMNQKFDDDKAIFNKIDKFFHAKARALIKESKDPRTIKLSCARCFRFKWKAGLIDDDSQTAWDSLNTMNFKRVDGKAKVLEDRQGKIKIISDIHIAYHCDVCQGGQAVGFEKWDLPIETWNLLEGLNYE